ncbi:glycosyltransferase family 4 protein [Actinomyces graevenitzii]|uniref:glycosyltransferase family 4 protein n=1 Tax=Actinomyces graevenitzii TaxID=55565 RepID=UPI0015E0B67E|nr:glycosyltransferase family 1 protein [Actinomyces graevenitzii]
MVVEQMWQPVPGGSGTYITNLAHSLRAQGVKVAGIAARRSHNDPGSSAVGLETMPVRYANLPRPALYESWNRLRSPLAEAILPASDLVHATTWAIPPTRKPLVVTVHDLAFLRNPEHFTKRGNSYFRKSLQRTIKEAQAVIVPSQATADDCYEAGINPERVHVIPHGVSVQEVSASQIDLFRTAYGLSRPYVLWTGTREPRKNLPGLLHAFSRIAGEFPQLDLVLVGPSGWGDDAVERQLIQAIGTSRVHVLGHLAQDTLQQAYAGARAFVFPSYWEGFGLPVLEAMAHSVPVVTSLGTSTAEVAGDCGILVEPSDPDQIAAGLRRVLGREHDHFALAGHERAQTMTWKACAKAHLRVYQQVMEQAQK